jgi:hypothetical protein
VLLRILVDESLPRQFAAEVPGHDVSTVGAQKWLGLRNGVLPRAAVGAGFEFLLTADRSVEFQQNLQAIGIAVIVLAVRNRMQDLRPLIPRILVTLDQIVPGQVVRIAD